MAATAGVATLGGALLLAATVCLTSGCSNWGYYAQSVSGHLAIVGAAKPVSDWVDDVRTDSRLRERLLLSQRIRDFATQELREPDNASYRRYADLHRGAAIWNVVATGPLSLELKTWCFPVVGCVGYRGYYEQSEAERYAMSLREQGLEVSVYGVPAYSTLGKLPGDFFADPLLNTFVYYTQGELARLIFHELAHQIAYAKGDTEFNESFATAVERIGAARWLKDHADDQAQAEFNRDEARRADFRALTARYRTRLELVYRSDRPDPEKLLDKLSVMAQLRDDYDTLKRERWGGFPGYDGWIARANNASFGVLAAYTNLAPNFERLFDRLGGDFPSFYAEVQRLAALKSTERRLALP